MRRSDYDDFHESLASPVESRYESDYWPVSNVISAIAGVIDVLLVIRFVIHLITSDTALGVVAVVNGLSGWIVAPFNGLLGITPTIGSGFVDWGAIIALLIISLVARLLIRVTRSARV